MFKCCFVVSPGLRIGGVGLQIWRLAASARMEKDRSAFKILTDKPTGKRLLGRPRCRWEANIRINLK